MSKKDIVSKFRSSVKDDYDRVIKSAVGDSWEVQMNDTPDNAIQEAPDSPGLLRSDAWGPYMVRGMSVTPEKFNKLSQPIRAAFIGCIERRRIRSLTP